MFNNIKTYVKNILKIKCFCRHEYKPHDTLYFADSGYRFKCIKCGKTIIAKDNKFEGFIGDDM